MVSEATENGNSEVPIDVSNWWSSAPSPPSELTEDVRRSMESGRDLLGDIYTTVVSMSHRRKLGTVFTPSAVTKHMLAQCESNGVKPAVVIDPGAGVGAFTLDSATRWKVPVVAVDLNVATLGFLAARCHFVGYETSTLLPQDGCMEMKQPAIHLVQGDFLAWIPDCLSQTSSPALIIGNPPYTRHQGIESNLKDSARDVAGPLISSGLAGMAAYFLAASLRFMRPSDALCMILPSSWMHAKYGSELRKHLWSLTHRRVQLSSFPHNSRVFPESKVDAVVLFVGPEEEERCPLTLAQAAFNGVHVKTVRTEDIDRVIKAPLSFPRSQRDLNRATKYPARLRDSFSIHRGIATGRNAFFLLSDAEVEHHQIPASALEPVVGSLKNMDVDRIDEETFARLGKGEVKRWILMLERSDISTPAIRRYLARGVRRGVNSGYLARHRRHWFALEDISPAPLLLLPMAKRKFRVVRDTKGVRYTNNLYGLYPINDDIDLDGAARWLRSHKGQEELLRVAHRYGGGMLKLEPRRVGDIEVPQSFARE